MTKSILLTWSSVCFCILNGFFNSALALDPPPKHNTSFNTYTLNADLKPIPSDSYQIAKATFLPDAAESLFSGKTTPYDYNLQGNCDDKGSLYTTKNCTYPKAVVAASQCPFRPGYYTKCVCLSKFKYKTCSSPYVVGGDSCDGKYEKCVCPSSVSLYYPNDYCTQYCEGRCVRKSCSPDRDETGCKYGTGYTSDGCGGSRIYCKACSPKSNETGCQYGTYSCSDGCGGTRTCCSSCTPKTDETGCQHGSYSCSDGCGGTRTCCSSCTPLVSETGCQYGTYSCSDGCGGTRTCCTSNPCSGVTCGANASCSGGTCSCNSGYEGNAYSGCTKIPTCTANSCSGYTLSSCPSNGQCSSCTVTNSDCSTGSKKYKLTGCNSGYELSGGSCVKTETCTANSCSGYTLSSCPTGASCSSCTIKNSNCSNGATKYKKTGCKSGYKDCNGSCIATSECCGGCSSNQECKNGTCVDKVTAINCRDYGLQESPTHGYICFQSYISSTSCWSCSPCTGPTFSSSLDATNYINSHGGFSSSCYMTPTIGTGYCVTCN